MAVENICKFNKFGYCKFKSNCRNKHVEEICSEKTCNQTTCEKRHPRLCKYFVKYGDCKLGSICAYSHINNQKMELEKLEDKVNELHLIIKSKEEIIDKLVKDVKILQVIVDQLGFAYEETYDEDENENEEENHENEEELYDKEIADIKSRDFLTKNLEHLDEMEMDIKKSRKNLRVKFQRYSNKMEAEIKNFNLLSCSFTMHQLCVHEIWELKDFLTKPETKSDKEEIIKVINKCRSRYRLLLNNMN